MNESSSARVALARKLRNGEYTLEQAEAELDRMEKDYGESAFLAGSVTRKEPPWTMGDLEDLNTEVTAGAGSRELFHYMAEVSDAVYRRRRHMIIAGGILGALAVIALLGGLTAALRQQQAEIVRLRADVEALQQAQIAAMQQYGQISEAV